MTLLVTGGGFIGSNLVDKLISQNHEVVCLDNFDTFYNPKIKRKNIRAALPHKSYALIEGDIRDASALLLPKQLLFCVYILIFWMERCGYKKVDIHPKIY